MANGQNGQASDFNERFGDATPVGEPVSLPPDVLKDIKYLEYRSGVSGEHFIILGGLPASIKGMKPKNNQKWYIARRGNELPDGKDV